MLMHGASMRLLLVGASSTALQDWLASHFPSVIPQMPRLSLLNHALL